MCVNQHYRIQAFGIDLFLQNGSFLGKITTRIYNEGIPLFVIHQISIFLNGAEQQGLNGQHSRVFVLLKSIYKDKYE